MTINLKLFGVKQLSKRLQKLKEEYEGPYAAAVMQTGYAIMAESVPLCPVATGRLRRSWLVSSPEKTFSGPIVTIGYGTQYAWIVHERTDSDVNWTAEGTGPKFLEKPLDAWKRKYARFVAGKVRENRRLGITAKSIPPRQPGQG